MNYLDYQSLFQYGVSAIGALGVIVAVVYAAGRAWEAGKIHAHQYAQNIVNNAILQGRNIEKIEQEKARGGDV